MIYHPLYYPYNPPRETFLLDKKIWLIITCGNKNILDGQRTRIPIFFFLTVPKVVKPTNNKRYYKTLGTNLINSPMSPSSLANPSIHYLYCLSLTCSGGADGFPQQSGREGTLGCVLHYSLKFYDKDFLFVGFTTLGTFIEFLFVLFWVS